MQIKFLKYQKNPEKNRNILYWRGWNPFSTGRWLRIWYCFTEHTSGFPDQQDFILRAALTKDSSDLRHSFRTPTLVKTSPLTHWSAPRAWIVGNVRRKQSVKKQEKTESLLLRWTDEGLGLVVAADCWCTAQITSQGAHCLSSTYSYIPARLVPLVMWAVLR